MVVKLFSHARNTIFQSVYVIDAKKQIDFDESKPGHRHHQAVGDWEEDPGRGHDNPSRVLAG